MQFSFYPQPALEPWLGLLAAWRLREFSVFPYLYDGRPADEERFSRAYAQIPGAGLVVATDAHGEVAGLCTGNPLASDHAAFAQKCYTPAEWFYVGEVIVAEKYRGQGLAGQMLERMEHESLCMGYTHLCLLCVQRADDHPLRPAQYQDPDAVWLRQGYHKLGLETVYKWRAWNADGSSSEQEHVMEYWGK